MYTQEITRRPLVIRATPASTFLKPRESIRYKEKIQVQEKDIGFGHERRVLGAVGGGGIVISPRGVTSRSCLLS